MLHPFRSAGEFADQAIEPRIPDADEAILPSGSEAGILRVPCNLSRAETVGGELLNTPPFTTSKTQTVPLAEAAASHEPDADQSTDTADSSSEERQICGIAGASVFRSIRPGMI